MDTLVVSFLGADPGAIPIALEVDGAAVSLPVTVDKLLGSAQA